MAKAIDILSTPESAPLLEQLAGQGRGRVFELSIEQINLGREDDNDIVISDESVSRIHARIEKNKSGEYVITDNKSKNGVFVNQQKVESLVLSHGDIIQMGHFTFRFRVPGASSPNLELRSQSKANSFKFGGLPKRATSNRKRLYLYAGLALFLGVVLMFSGEDTTKPAEEKKTVKSEDAEFTPTSAPEYKDGGTAVSRNNLEDPLIKTEKEISNLENKESYIKEAESYFRKGQRDYFNKNYQNAIDNFDAAISLWAQHPLAQYYRGLAIHDSEVEAQKHREIGLKYYNSLQYRRAMYHFKAAIDSLAHIKSDNNPAQKMIQECQRYYEFSQRKLKAAEMVP